MEIFVAVLCMRNLLFGGRGQCLAKGMHVVSLPHVKNNVQSFLKKKLSEYGHSLIKTETA
jgi:hypothetical protein